MIINNVNPTKLLDEFNTNQINWVSATNNLKYDERGIPLSNIADLTVEFEEGTKMNLVQSIIEAHDPTPLPQPQTIEEQLAEKDAQILKLKEEQFMTQKMTIQNAETQQELIELLMMIGVL